MYFTFLVILLMVRCPADNGGKISWNENIKVVLSNTKPLKYGRDNRLSLYLWPAIDPGKIISTARQYVRFLDPGIPVLFDIPAHAELFL
jgi:hypothetical protein